MLLKLLSNIYNNEEYQLPNGDLLITYYNFEIDNNKLSGQEVLKILKYQYPNINDEEFNLLTSLISESNDPAHDFLSDAIDILNKYHIDKKEKEYIELKQKVEKEGKLCNNCLCSICDNPYYDQCDRCDNCRSEQKLFAFHLIRCDRFKAF